MVSEFREYAEQQRCVIQQASRSWALDQSGVSENIFLMGEPLEKSPEIDSDSLFGGPVVRRMHTRSQGPIPAT